MVELSNSLVTAQALLEDTCAAILVEAEFAGTVELEDWANSATAVGRYVSDVQKLGESDLFTPMTTSTLPEVSAPAASVETSTTSSFRPSWSARAAAMSTSMPTIFVEEEGWPAKGALFALTPTRRTPSWAMTGLLTAGVASGGVYDSCCCWQPVASSSMAAQQTAAAQHAAKRLRCFMFRLPPSRAYENKLLPTDLVFDPTLAHRGLAFAPPSPPSRRYAARINGGCVLPLGYAVLAFADAPRDLRGSFRPHLPWTRAFVESPQLQTRKKP